MTIALAFTAAVALFLAFTLRFALKEGVAERRRLEDRIDSLVAAGSQERREHEKAMLILLDKVQHPEMRHVEPAEPIEPLRTDEQELAHVGDIVPDFVNVGSHEQMLSQEQEPGTINE